jgi:DNA-binding CsgD family transcriptional regulator
MNSEPFPSEDRTDVRSWVAPVGVLLFAGIAALVAADIAADYGSGTEPGHLLAEGFVMILALAGGAVLVGQLIASRRLARQLTVDLAAARREADQFRDEAAMALRGLGEAIDRQFERWKLTPAEREVGLLLLKGLSQKEAAAARSTTETTVRQQALAIYRKSGLRNRSELAAFFLEDLLLPSGRR